MDIDLADMTMGWTISYAEAAFCLAIPEMESCDIEFEQCCQANDLLGAMAIYDANPHMSQSFNFENSFELVCAHGNFVFARWIYTVHCVYPKHPAKIIYHMCEKGHLDILQWMHEIGFIDDTPMKRAYFLTVKNNHVHVTNWIVDKYPTFNRIGLDEEPEEDFI